MSRWSSDLLEYEALRALLGRYVSSLMGKAVLERLAPSTDRIALAETFADTAEAIAYHKTSLEPQPAVRGAAIRLRFDSLPDPSPQGAKLAIEGAVLDGKEIFDLLALLDRASEARAILMAAAGRFPRLATHAAAIGEFRPLLRELAGRILPDGTVADTASVALNRIRRDMERQQRLIQESLERFLRDHRDEGILQEEFVTLRNERFVVPVVAGQQRKVAGVIHAASGTGHTLFMEPLETVELNNDLVRLREQETREVHRILQEMTERLRAVAGEISATAAALGELEFLFAKARFAAEFDAVVPRFSEETAPRLRLVAARHPLLEDVLRRQRRPVVPLTLTLEDRVRTLLISGPNTGGKTVALKTVGLLVLMSQSGVPVPCQEAELPVFGQVLADIGDNQSIEQSLSTFSAHVTRIKEMVELLEADSLVLLDELGRATDPEEGGALGVAIVDYMRRHGAFILASTHLLAPKIYGASTEGVVNGSMSFDERTLEPTYRLRLGAPGASAGIDIAQRLGLPVPLIETARGSLSGAQREIARFLKLIEERLDSVSRLEEELRRNSQALEAERAGLKQAWEKRETAKLHELERRSELLFGQFEARAEQVIGQILESAAQKKAASQARRKVARAQREWKEEFDATVLSTGDEARHGAPARPHLVEGARVRLKGVREPARVRRLLGEDSVEVEAGFLKLQVPVDDVVEVLPETPEKAKAPRGVTVRTGPQFAPLAREINVIGRRAEEACGEVDKFLDNAVLASVERVRIVHGHGMGILKRAIGELLKEHPHVARFYEASAEEGGGGATIVELREE